MCLSLDYGAVVVKSLPQDAFHRDLVAGFDLFVNIDQFRRFLKAAVWITFFGRKWLNAVQADSGSICWFKMCGLVAYEHRCPRQHHKAARATGKCHIQNRAKEQEALRAESARRPHHTQVACRFQEHVANSPPGDVPRKNTPLSVHAQHLSHEEFGRDLNSSVA